MKICSIHVSVVVIYEGVYTDEISFFQCARSRFSRDPDLLRDHARTHARQALVVRPRLYQSRTVLPCPAVRSPVSISANSALFWPTSLSRAAVLSTDASELALAELVIDAASPKHAHHGLRSMTLSLRSLLFYQPRVLQRDRHCRRPWRCLPLCVTLL